MPRRRRGTPSIVRAEVAALASTTKGGRGVGGRATAPVVASSDTIYGNPRGRPRFTPIVSVSTIFGAAAMGPTTLVGSIAVGVAGTCAAAACPMGGRRPDAGAAPGTRPGAAAAKHGRGMPAPGVATSIGQGITARPPR